MPTVYLAGPIEGRSMEQANGWRSTAAQLLRLHGVEVRNSLRGKLLEARDRLPSTPLAEQLLMNRSIVARDRMDVMASDLVFAYMDKGPRSGGALIELGWADAWRKPIVLVLEEGDSLEYHPFIQQITAAITHDFRVGIDVALSYLDAL